MCSIIGENVSTMTYESLISGHRSQERGAPATTMATTRDRLHAAAAASSHVRPGPTVNPLYTQRETRELLS